MATGERVPDAAAIVLAGGRSTRMGTSKAALEWHGSTLLARITGLLARTVAGPVVVARAPGQELGHLHELIAAGRTRPAQDLTELWVRRVRTRRNCSPTRRWLRRIRSWSRCWSTRPSSTGLCGPADP